MGLPYLSFEDTLMQENTAYLQLGLISKMLLNNCGAHLFVFLSRHPPS